MRPLHEQKVLLLHPFLNYYGGAEYLLSVVAKDVAPNADIFCFSYENKVLKEMGIDASRVHSSLGGDILSKLYRQATPLYPAIVDTLNLDVYDLILSFTYGYVHGAVTSHLQPHISYVQTPMRLLWLKENEYYWYDKVPGVREVYRSILAWQRVWDRQAAMRPDYLLTNSSEVQNRVKTFWGRDSEVIYPPVDTMFYKPAVEVKKEDYFITHSRLVRYKRIDILIEACKSTHKKLMVVGDGPDYKRLKEIAGTSSDITFTGYVTHEQKKELLQKAKGFLFAAYEDFGISPVEAMAAGVPVLAFGKGGVTETVHANSGMFYKEQTPESIGEQLQTFEGLCGNVHLASLFNQAEKFSKERFIAKYMDRVNSYCNDFLDNKPPVIV